MSTPSFKEMLEQWQAVVNASDPFLDTLTTQKLQEELLHKGKTIDQTAGTAMHRLIYHYWYHTGEIQAIRQLLGHKQLAEYVGEIEDEAPYRPH